MIINFKGAKTYLGPGGKSLDINKRTLCFLHGSGQNHLSFIQQARFFAYKGYSVIAVSYTHLTLPTIYSV